MRRMLLTLLALWLPATVALAGESADRVHEYRLDNGLRLIVKEDHRAPVVVSQVWYRVGSSYEHDGITGISHVLEHMMFKGTERFGPGEFSRIIAENGGRENAFTSRDYTAYFQRLEKSRLAIAFELEADRMRNLRLDPEEVKKEVKVVMEERRLRTEDNPQALTFEQFNATAFLNSPYRIPTIGWMDDLENLKIEDLQAWYEKWYAPNNAILVVAGDVDPQAVLALAKKHYGPLRPSRIEPPKPRREMVQRGERRIRVRVPAELPYILMGYKVPVVLTAEGDWEPYALEVAAGILDGGNSARLARELVRGQEVAASAGAGYDLYDRQESLFLLDGTPANGHDIAELEKALREQVRRLQTRPVTADELARVKAQVLAGAVFEEDSVFYQAMRIGRLVSVGLDWRLDEQYADRIRAVTPEQVQAVARKYLRDERLTVAVLDPLPMDAEMRARARAAQMRGGAHGH
ncbi:M16 family metallopeptidase [Thiohalobacter sp.]|uniref:M16 family metallopeptidase n=1 Tax=Thiohalobacter sp. TaxID=2025948 RepID=UPI00294FF3C2|nr:pitrilysin family protein [Thiohalobacter sp.]